MGLQFKLLTYSIISQFTFTTKLSAFLCPQCTFSVDKYYTARVWGASKPHRFPVGLSICTKQFTLGTDEEPQSSWGNKKIIDTANTSTENQSNRFSSSATGTVDNTTSWVGLSFGNPTQGVAIARRWKLSEIKSMKLDVLRGVSLDLTNWRQFFMRLFSYWS